METFLPVNEFDVIINSEDGERDTMHSGSFRNIICSAGKIYSIQWKLKGESKWHEIIERIPEKIKSINKQNFRDANGQLYFENVQLDNSDRLKLDYDWFPDIPNPYI